MQKASFVVRNFPPPDQAENCLHLQFKIRWLLEQHSRRDATQEPQMQPELRLSSQNSQESDAISSRNALPTSSSQHLSASNSSSSDSHFPLITCSNTIAADLPHIHVSLVNANNSNDNLLFFASSLELSCPTMTDIYAPIDTKKCNGFFQDCNNEVNLSIRILFQTKMEQRMNQWTLVEESISWKYQELLRHNLLREQQLRQHRKEVLSLKVIDAHNTTCAVNRDHLGQCNNGSFFFFEDMILHPFDEIEYEVAKEGKCKGSIQMVIVTKRMGEFILCETPLFTTGNWQKYNWQCSSLSESRRSFLRSFFSGSNHHRCEKVTLGFYFLGSFGICNIRSVRFFQFSPVLRLREKSRREFSDVDIVCDR